ncbi:GNAT family N-acetyltransferase [Parabacteroides sp. OttesenSCG-928-O15]|nr:GNAT family N-acetyltransferase [Parabacteroides sp. OttesenSCG-928-O15]
MFTIRKTTEEDIPAVLDIFAYARQFMARTGNPNQWINGYPAREHLQQDMKEGNSYVCLDGEGDLVGTFYFKIGEEPTYAHIYEGEWLDCEPYGVAHRIASSGKQKGIALYCLDWCFRQCGNMRVDTHRDNQVMQSILQKMGYKRCGIIYLQSGAERIAFQKNS